MNEYQEALDFIIAATNGGNGMVKELNTLQELVERATPMKPIYEADGYDENGKLIYDTWICPNCDKKYEVDYDEYDHCPNCGKALDWCDEE